MTASTLGAQSPTLHSDPPPVNESALADKLFAMIGAHPGERAVILHDPTYYPGITDRLRRSLHGAGVQTYVLVEDTPEIIETYRGDPQVASRREEDVVETLLPVFRTAQIFYRMPTRGDADDLRWERLVAASRVRSVHFHWPLPLPGDRTAVEIESHSRLIERRSLEIDFEAHARFQRRLADALRGETLRLTTPEGTDLRLGLPRDQWFHMGDGDMSRTRAIAARSIRDRQMELPVGIFNFVPRPKRVSGVVVAPRIHQAAGHVRGARLELLRGRVVRVTATEGELWILERMREVGTDGDLIGTVFLDTHPMDERSAVTIDIGGNWENGGSNRTQGKKRMTIRLEDATLVAGARTIMRDGRYLLTRDGL